MEGPISFWGYKEQESNLIFSEHDDDDDDDDEEKTNSFWLPSNTINIVVFDRNQKNVCFF